MTVYDRLTRAKDDVIKIKESVPNSKANKMELDSLLKAEVAINDVLFHSEHLEVPC